MDHTTLLSKECAGHVDVTPMEEITIWSETKKGGKVVERFPPSTTSINLSDRRIGSTDLTPLDQFPNLEAFVISGNELQSIDLSYLKTCENLLELSLGSNEMETIDLAPLASCTSLMHLDVSFIKL